MYFLHKATIVDGNKYYYYITIINWIRLKFNVYGMFSINCNNKIYSPAYLLQWNVFQCSKAQPFVAIFSSERICPKHYTKRTFFKGKLRYGTLANACHNWQLFAVSEVETIIFRSLIVHNEIFKGSILHTHMYHQVFLS